MTGASVQLGPRSVGRRCAAWGLAVARNRFIVGVVIGFVLFEAVLAVVMLMLGHAVHRDSVPAVFTPPTTVFCPSGQHVTGVSASGWPDCAPDR